ncbi:galactofuranose ABC transporter, ATP-binding protein YtfT [Microvirga rosea]|uniref:galactofuranose ABC transporter, ATP-binding protein YtfT n=1 Tax=Microvirga rosea TaxID=2715425 RepID=UPI001D0A9D9F|nr:galactofuranose ABC transporter, ATP-binding protein YtfT [Microvirga rosea]MCB8820842.1 ABC transporter permease [Microvirga rosea]
MSGVIRAQAPRSFPKGLPQLLALLVVFLVNWFVFRDFFAIRIQDGRLFGSVVDVLNRGAPVAILSLGMTLVIATRGIDLSVGAVMAIAGATAATLTAQGYPLPTALAAAAGIGLLCGLWNGFLVAVLEIQPFVATLILMVAGRGFAQLITEGQIITFVSEGFAAIGSGSFLMLPMPVVIAIVVLIITHLVVRYTALGLFIEAIGANVRSSGYAGISTRAVTIAVYMWCSLCAAIAGLIVTADIRGADANNAGLWLELDAILAVVIGGTSLFGGRFSLGLSVVGALIIQAMNTGILLSGFQPEYNLIVKAIVVLAVLLAQSPVFGGFRAVLRAKK